MKLAIIWLVGLCHLASAGQMKPVFLGEIQTACFDSRKGTLYFVLTSSDNCLRSFSLGLKEKKLVKRFRGLKQICDLKCCGHGLIFRAQDKDSVQEASWGEVYQWKKVYYNLKTDQRCVMSDEWQLEFLSPDKLVGYYGQDYIGIIYFPAKAVRKIEEVGDLALGLCPLGDKLFWYPCTSESGETTQLFARSLSGKLPSRLLREAGEFSEAALIDGKTLFIAREGQAAFLYRIDTRQRIPLNLIAENTFCLVKDSENSFFLAFSLGDDWWLYYIGLKDGRILEKRFLPGYAEAMTIQRDKLYMVVKYDAYGLWQSGLYVLNLDNQ